MTAMPVCPHCGRGVILYTTILASATEPAPRATPTAPPPVPDGGSPSARPGVARYFAGACRKCGVDVFLDWQPGEGKSYLCGACFRETRDYRSVRR